MARSKEKVPGPEGLRRWTPAVLFVLNIALPIVLLALVRSNLVPLAILLALFSKWRVFALRPRHLFANLRANMTDILVKLGSLIFIIQADTFTTQLAWTGWYIIWLTLIKPQSGRTWMALQAMVGQVIGLSALYQFSETIPSGLKLAIVWLIASATARHFLVNYDDTWARTIPLMWGLFVVELAWLLDKWLLVYVFVPQIVLLIVVISYAAGSIYDAAQKEELKSSFVRQQVFIASIIIAVIVFLGDWQGQI